MKLPDLTELMEFLPCRTPDEWLAEAARPENLQTLLCDHANLEQKAAQSALTMIRRYANGLPGFARSSNGPHAKPSAANTAVNQKCGDSIPDLLAVMSRLAREELRHFEQVLALMRDREMAYVHVSPARYAAGLRQPIRTHEPGRLVDTLIAGAFIEARSCERFNALMPVLDEELGAFYGSLLKSEARHYQHYLQLATRCSDVSIEPRVELFRELEADLVESPDNDFRFHSGSPAGRN